MIIIHCLPLTLLLQRVFLIFFIGLLTFMLLTVRKDIPTIKLKKNSPFNSFRVNKSKSTHLRQGNLVYGSTCCDIINCNQIYISRTCQKTGLTAFGYHLK